jgi:hypothetical protein
LGVERDSTDNPHFVFAEEFSALQKRKIAIIGRVWGLGTPDIEGFGQYTTPAFNGYLALVDLIDTLGSLNKDGNVFIPSDQSNLRMTKSSGHSFRFSANFLGEPTSPHVHENPTMSDITEYHYHYFNAGATVLHNYVDPTKYDVDGTLTTVPNGKFTIQRIHYFPKSNVVDIIYGQDIYDTLIEAENHIYTEQVKIDTANLKTLNGSILRGYVIISMDCTDLSDSTKATILSVANLGAGASSSGAIGITDHGELFGLGDDDHPQYYNQTRGDGRYIRIGDTSMKGDTGVKGDTGTQGDTGIQGIIGDTGIQGIQGFKGDTGTQGIKGDTGTKGDKGDTELKAFKEILEILEPKEILV